MSCFELGLGIVGSLLGTTILIYSPLLEEQYRYNSEPDNKIIRFPSSHHRTSSAGIHTFGCEHTKYISLSGLGEAKTHKITRR